MKLTNIRTFPNAKPDKAQALKVLEEAAEVVEAFKQRDPRDETHTGYATANVLDEIADTIQASCNLAAALGVTDLTPYLARCEERNRRRGAVLMGWILCTALFVLTLVCIVSLAAMAIAITITIITELL